VFVVPAAGTYSSLQTLLLDLSGPLSAERTWRVEDRRGRGRKEREREGWKND